MKETKISLNNFNNLNEALNVFKSIDTATDEDLVAARLTINQYLSKLSGISVKLDNKIKDNASKKAQENTLFAYEFNDGSATHVMSETSEHVVIDMQGIHKDAAARVIAEYSDPAYANLFTAGIRCKRADIIKAAEDGSLPNASNRVKTIKVDQIKLFDVKPNADSNK